MNAETVHKISNESKEPNWFLAKRLSALKHFQELPMLKLKYGLGIMINIDFLKLEEINPLDYQDDIIIVQDNNVKIINFKEAQGADLELIKDYFMTKCVSPNENKISAMHATFVNKGFLIHVPENTAVEAPIIINIDLKSKSS